MRAEQRVAEKFLARGRVKTAGEVRFIKDRGGDDSKSWGWGTPGPTNREMDSKFDFNPKYLKPLAETLRASLMALGHVQSAYNTFTKMKSAQVSPDGALGGKGYIQKITDMRKQYMNCSEALSSLTDTLYDEMKAPHWDPEAQEQGKRERDEVKEIMNDVDEIRQDPEGWAEEEEEDMDAPVAGENDDEAAPVDGATDSSPMGKTASRVAFKYLQGRGQ